MTTDSIPTDADLSTAEFTACSDRLSHLHREIVGLPLSAMAAYLDKAEALGRLNPAAWERTGRAYLAGRRLQVEAATVMCNLMAQGPTS